MARNGTISPKRIHGHEVDTRRTCKGEAWAKMGSRNKGKRPCKLHPIVDGDFCPYHDPSTQKKINRAGRRGIHQQRQKSKR